MKKLIKSHANVNPNYRVITLEKPLSIAAESYRKVKVTLDFANVDEKIQVIQFVSSLQGEGKTTTCLNVAATYLEDGLKVCVVDLDLRRPKIHRTFEVKNENGLVDYLAGNISLEECIKHGQNGIDFINSGSKVPSPTSILNSNNIESLFTTLRGMYDVILVDCTPVLMVSDAIISSRLTDGCIFVISEDVTEKQAAKASIKLLNSNNVRILGSVFNGSVHRSKRYTNDSYRYINKYYGKN